MDKMNYLTGFMGVFIIYMILGFALNNQYCKERHWWFQLVFIFAWPVFFVAYFFVCLLVLPMKILSLFCKKDK